MIPLLPIRLRSAISDEFGLNRGDRMFRSNDFLWRGPARRRRRRSGPVLYAAESLERRVLLAIPHIGSADAAPDPIAPGGALTLTARSVTGTVDELDFYRESNGTAGLQTA